jgi:putative cell wall-binding protein
VTRLSGADRYGTAVAVSREAFSPGVETVYVASGLGFPDALAGAAVAGGSGSPLLLVRPTAIPTVVATELARLKPKRIVALGGPASISDGLLNSLAAYALEGVTRLGGADRFETAVALSQAAFPDGAAVVYVVSGLGFADALAAAPAAARDDAPVLLVAPDDLPDATRDELSRLAPARIVVVGGTAAVNGAVVNSMKALLPASDLVRIAGADRYATAAAVAATFDHGLPVIYLASGLGFADALAAAAAAGARGVPVLLTRTAALPTEAAVAIHGLAPVSAIVVGSTAVVGPPVIWSVRNALAVAT